jgi:hypothetical protein
MLFYSHVLYMLLCSIGLVCKVSGFVVLLVNNVTDWQTMAGLHAALPIFTVLYVAQVSPHKISRLRTVIFFRNLRCIIWLRTPSNTVR